MNNSINKEMEFINSSFAHNIQYLVDAQSKKKTITGLPKRVTGGKGFEHINSRYMVNKNIIAVENADQNLNQGSLINDYTNLGNINVSRNNHSSLNVSGHRPKNNHTFLNHKNKQYLTMNNRQKQNGKHPSRESSAGRHKIN